MTSKSATHSILTLRISDDGAGIDPSIMDGGGRAGSACVACVSAPPHWSTLTIASSAGGTRITLVVPLGASCSELTLEPIRQLASTGSATSSPVQTP